MQKHELNIFPEMNKEDYELLFDDIKNNGYNENYPIYLYKEKVLDGWNRYQVCQKLGIKPLYKTFKGTDETALNWVFQSNKRRNLNAGQWSCIVAEAEEIQKIISEQSQKREKSGRKLQSNPTQLIVEGSRSERETNAQLADNFNTNRTYVGMAINLKKDYPEKFKEVKSGKKTMTQVQRELKHESLKIPKTPTGKYRIIYADPPWKYNDKLEISKTGVGESYGSADAHYPQMSIDELCLLPIKDIAEDNSVLFLWTTSPLLEDTFKIIKAWGFNYKASFIWDKIKHNMGHYNSVRHEFLLICTRGSCTPDNKKLYDSVQHIERSKKHSEKPEEFRKIIEDIYIYGEKIELFARKEHLGWKSWGNEV